MPMLISCIPPISKIVRMVEEKPCTSEARIPKIGISKILKTRTRSNTINEIPDINNPLTKTAVSGVVEKLKIPSKASFINLCSGYFVTPAARGSRS